eukprot:3901315-Pyramimonas_sp.AAC.1
MFERYLEHRLAVSSACRLTLDEEQFLIKRALDNPSGRLPNMYVVNRKAFIQELLKNQSTLACVPNSTDRPECNFVYSAQHIPHGALPYERLVDKSALTCNIRAESLWKQASWIVYHAAYERPRPMVGAGMLRKVHDWMDKSRNEWFRLSSTEDLNGLGFLFFYEMLTGSLNFTYGES